MAKRERKQRNWSLAKVVEFAAYIGIGLIAVALLLAVTIGSSSISNAFNLVGQALAYVVTMIVAGLWVRRKQHVAWLICYVIFVVSIIILYILGIVL